MVDTNQPTTKVLRSSFIYATVKDHIISDVQRTYRHGQDITISLRELKKRDLTSEEPTRKISSRTDDNKKIGTR